MAITLHNTLTRRKETFTPLDPANVRMYVCGPTVYDFAHIGNARPVVVFDVLFRLLRHVYGEAHVTYARNITDVDDKIIDRARESGRPIDAITAETTQAYNDDMAALNALPPTIAPRATQHIGQMVAMIERLIASGHAYAAEGHVLFAVATKPDYGKLSGRSRDEQIAGARVEVAPYKRDPADFVLWKPSTQEQPGWESPWGRGRPGWHIECSAMSESHLGITFDIHGGGNDLVFPHHENEIAQSESAHGAGTFARVWMHNGFLMVNGEKMSKSLGNFFTVHDLIEEFPGEAIRLLLLKAHYRAPLDFTKEGVREAVNDLDRLYRALELADSFEELIDFAPSDHVLTPLLDDLNTPGAIAGLHTHAKAIFREFPRIEADVKAFRASIGGRRITSDDLVVLGKRRPTLADLFLHVMGDRTHLLYSGRLLGLLTREPADWFRTRPRIGVPKDDAPLRSDDIDARVAELDAARADKDYATADRVRAELREVGVSVSTPRQGPSKWSFVVKP